MVCLKQGINYVFAHLYLYNTNSVCVCVSVKYRRPNGWTDHDQIWHVYADRPGNGSYQKKMVPRVVRKGGLIGAILRSGYLAGGQRAFRAVANGRCRGSEPLAKQREEL